MEICVPLALVISDDSSSDGEEISESLKSSSDDGSGMLRRSIGTAIVLEI